MEIGSEMWILATLALLFAKHYYVDFVIQTNEEVKGKGVYGNLQGIKHSLKQALGTFLVFGLAGTTLAVIVIVGNTNHIAWINLDDHCTFTTKATQIFL